MSSAAVTSFIQAGDRPFAYMSHGHVIVRLGSDVDRNCVVLSDAMTATERATYLQELAAQVDALATGLLLENAS